MKLFCFSILLHFGLLLEPQPCDFLAYRRRFGDMCEEKMLNPKGTGGELVMKMIDDANNMMVVSMLWLQ